MREILPAAVFCGVAERIELVDGRRLHALLQFRFQRATRGVAIEAPVRHRYVVSTRGDDDETSPSPDSWVADATVRARLQIDDLELPVGNTANVRASQRTRLRPQCW